MDGDMSDNSEEVNQESEREEDNGYVAWEESQAGKVGINTHRHTQSFSTCRSGGLKGAGAPHECMCAHLGMACVCTFKHICMCVGLYTHVDHTVICFAPGPASSESAVGRGWAEFPVTHLKVVLTFKTKDWHIWVPVNRVTKAIWMSCILPDAMEIWSKMCGIPWSCHLFGCNTSWRYCPFHQDKVCCHTTITVPEPSEKTDK